MSATVQESREANNPKWFRQVLGQYPTGVCVVTATPSEGPSAGMVVGSFTSVSLDPPLVAFLPDRGSSTWPRIQGAGKFCVNILGADQESICRNFASKAVDKFEGQLYRMSTLGSPILENAVAWMDCEIDSVTEAGDHYIVVGLVRDLQIERGGLPLLFFQGGYGRFSPLSLSAADPMGTITQQLLHVDVARPEMELLAADLSARCIATARVDKELVVAASAGNSRRDSVMTLVGQRLPLIPPTGSVFLAWKAEAEIDAWLAKSPLDCRGRFKLSLNTVRERGYSISLLSDAQRKFVSTLDRLVSEGAKVHEVDLSELIQSLSYDPAELSPEVLNDVRLVSVPVFGPGGEVVLAMTIFEFAKPTSDHGVRPYIERAMEAARRVTEKLGGRSPSA